MAVRIESKAEPIPGYRLIERLGGGGFGEVWRAEAPGGLQKAIKFVFGDLSAANDNTQRAEQELKALSRVKTVRHPYILSLERFDIIDGQLLIVMELADRNLWDRYKECRTQGLPGIPREELLGYMQEAAEALDLMNQQYQLQHLDIKPQNLFLVHQHVKVADFGLVKDLEGMQASVTGGVTPVYAAPETFDGWVSRFSDQYSLAIVYQELLTGQRPFPGSNVRQLILQHLQGTPNVNPLPPGDREAITRALAKNPAERFPTCADLVRALRLGSPSPEPGARSPESGGQQADALEGQRLPPTPVDAVAAGRSGRPLSPDSRVPASGEETPEAEADTGSGQATHFIRGAEGAVLRPAEAIPRGAAPRSEITGPGTLFPALVIGLGQLGMTVLQRLREHLTTQVGPPAQLPNLRLLLLDTDPDVVRAAIRGLSGGAPVGPLGTRTCLGPEEVLLAPLNRPSYYLKQRDGRAALESWLNPRMLYRIPRSQVTTGVRALGRLAFCDNYRHIARRLQQELQACTDPGALSSAIGQTKLGLRTSRPRVYVITSLAGGTGSGMFIDLAYTLRALLRQMGYDPPDIVGLFLLPAVDASRTRVLSLGNAYAALTELSHFGAPGQAFSAQYHEREPKIEDSAPPFSRYLLLPLPEETDDVACGETVELGAQFLYRDLCSPLGRVADLGRAGLNAPPWETRGQFFDTFGLFQLSWPRHALLRAAARQLCQRLVQRWMSKDAKPIRAVVQEWVQQQWLDQGLDAESFLHRLQSEAVKALGRPPDSVLAECLEPLAPWGPIKGPGTQRPEGQRRRGGELGLDPEALQQALQGLEELLGRPGDDSPDPAGASGSLVRLLKQSADCLTRDWGQRLAELAVHLIEEPAFRLAGAEEAVRQLVATIEQALQRHEPLAQDLAQRAADAYVRLVGLVRASSAAKSTRPPPPAEVVELVRNYSKCRYQSIVLGQLSSAFLTLRGHLSDQLREINFCRVRLSELLRLLEEGAAGARPAGGIGRRLFLSGCKDQGEALEQLLAVITPDDLLELDGQMEEVLRRDHTALVHVCLSNANLLKNVEMAMLEMARCFAAGKLPEVSVAELFQEQHPDAEQAEGEVAAYFDEAAPELSTGRGPRSARSGSELVVLAVPPGEAGDRFRELAQRAVSELEVHQAASADDVLIYRERAHLALGDLEHLGPVGRDAYAQMTATENFTPHTRNDVDFRSH
jgi:hypothetical protein